MQAGMQAGMQATWRNTMAALLTLTVLHGPAAGAPPDPAEARPPAATAEAPPPQVGVQQHDLSDLGPPSDAALLARTRGGAGASVNDTRLSGVVSGNSALQVVTGDNVIQASSFADAAGMPVVIQNSGANVLIQNATVINLKFN